jgi:hypothetical protein
MLLSATLDPIVKLYASLLVSCGLERESFK